MQAAFEHGHKAAGRASRFSLVGCLSTLATLLFEVEERKKKAPNLARESAAHGTGRGARNGKRRVARAAGYQLREVAQ